MKSILCAEWRVWYAYGDPCIVLHHEFVFGPNLQLKGAMPFWVGSQRLKFGNGEAGNGLHHMLLLSPEDCTS